MIPSSNDSSNVSTLGAFPNDDWTLRQECIQTLNIDPWIKALSERPKDSWYPIEQSVNSFLIELYVHAPFGQGALILLKSLTNAQWDLEKYSKTYNMLLKCCAKMEDLLAVDAILAFMKDHTHLLDEESLKSLDEINRKKMERSGWQQEPEKRIMPDGSVHEGIFDKGLLHGFGRITRSDGKIEQGVYRNGLLEGPGIFAGDRHVYVNEQFFWEGLAGGKKR